MKKEKIGLRSHCKIENVTLEAHQEELELLNMIIMTVVCDGLKILSIEKIDLLYGNNEGSYSNQGNVASGEQLVGTMGSLLWVNENSYIDLLMKDHCTY